ncbi:MAG: PIG-L deacetylase family protein, partial [Pyrinomonadaceae bacterium]
TIFFGFETIADEANFQEATRKLSEAIDSFDPEEIYTLHPILDRHSSHRAAGQITLDACKNRDVSIWAYEVWGLFAEWDRFEDISDHIETKLTAINEHRSQVAAIPYTEGVAGLNRWRAIFADPHQATVPCAYAEVFVKLR